MLMLTLLHVEKMLLSEWFLNWEKIQSYKDAAAHLNLSRRFEYLILVSIYLLIDTVIRSEIAKFDQNRNHFLFANISHFKNVCFGGNIEKIDNYVAQL